MPVSGSTAGEGYESCLLMKDNRFGYDESLLRRGWTSLAFCAVWRLTLSSSEMFDPGYNTKSSSPSVVIKRTFPPFAVLRVLPRVVVRRMVGDAGWCCCGGYETVAMGTDGSTISS